MSDIFILIGAFYFVFKCDLLDLIAISYKNIGPFQNKLLSIFFSIGKMLIKAPIGSGKSFLFFDGPIYGLYKYSARNVLNIKSSEGFIKVLVEVNQEKYLIIRQIKKGKVKESCMSKVYKIQGDFQLPTTSSPLQEDQDIETLLLQQPAIQREEIQFKNETDLQQTLQTILPPREVIMNTIFLMQDSDNIFELTPTDRLTILKNVFNLMGIDDAKDILADKKREIRYKIKATTDISKYDEKLRTRIQKYITIFESTSQSVQKEIDTQPYRNFFDEREHIASKITITDFSLTDFPTDRHQQLETWIGLQNTQKQHIDHNLQTLLQEQKQYQQKITEKQQGLKELSLKITQVQQNLATLDEEKLAKIKEQKQTIVQQQLSTENQLSKDIIWNFIQNQFPFSQITNPNDINIQSNYALIQELINQGKNIAEEIKNIQLQVQNYTLMQKNEQEKHATQRAHMIEKIADLDKQITAIEKTIQKIEQNIQEQEVFACKKIKEPCPFIKIINKKTFDQLDEQKQTLKGQYQTLTVQKTTLQETVQTMEASTLPTYQQEKEKLDQSLQLLEQKKEHIKNFLQEIVYKEREKEYLGYLQQEKEIKQLDTLIHTQEQQMKQREDRKQQLQTYTIQHEHEEQQIKEFQEMIKQKEQEYKNFLTQQQDIDIAKIQNVENNYREMTEIYRDIDMLINDFKALQVEKKQLEDQETIINNLYTIFAKELLLLVVQDHLPTINDIINNYLAQIVSYQINLQLNKSDADKIELEAKIIDEKGMRDTKSLSGGQRIILKLIRMLAISSYINSPILFLDETINNLDAETIGKVANILEDFVKQKNMKFYTITHSQQIQEMDIRDHTIEINMNLHSDSNFLI